MMRVDNSQRYPNWIVVETGGKTLYFPKEQAQELRNVLSKAGTTTQPGDIVWENAAYRVCSDSWGGVNLTSKDPDGRVETRIERATARTIAQELDNLALREAEIQRGYDRLKGKS